MTYNYKVSDKQAYVIARGAIDNNLISSRTGVFRTREQVAKDKQEAQWQENRQRAKNRERRERKKERERIANEASKATEAVVSKLNRGDNAYVQTRTGYQKGTVVSSDNDTITFKFSNGIEQKFLKKFAHIRV